MNGLEFYSTGELLDELLARKTFVGVVIYSSDDHKFDGQVHNQIAVRATTDFNSTLKLLGSATESVENQVRKDESC